MTIDEARPYIELALGYTGGTHDFGDIKKGVEDGRFQFWPGPHSAVITELIDYPKFRTLHFFLAAGNSAELEPMILEIEKWGRTRGATRAAFTGRKGWERAFPTRPGFDYKPHAVSFTKEL